MDFIIRDKDWRLTSKTTYTECGYTAHAAARYCRVCSYKQGMKEYMTKREKCAGGHTIVDDDA